MSAPWQEVCRLVAPYGQVLHSMLVVSQNAGDLPLPVSELKFRRALAYLAHCGKETANRGSMWLTALRTLPPHRTDLLIDYDWIVARTGQRRYDAPIGTFPLLLNDLNRWIMIACRELQTDFEQREPVTRSSAERVSRHISRAATLLVSSGCISQPTQLVRLEQVIAQETFDTWLNIDDEHSPASTLATIDAFVRVRKDFYGEDDVVSHMRRQRIGRRDPHALSGTAVEQVTNMISDGRTIELLPFALIEIASRNPLPVHTRLKLANLAPAVHAAITYALRPTDVFGMEHMPDFGFLPPVNYRKAGQIPIAQDCRLRSLLQQRADIREALGARPSCVVLVGNDGNPMDAKSASQSFKRTQTQFGLIRHPWQRFRDYAAARMLLSAEDKLLVASDLLEVASPVLVHRRYAAILPRNPIASDLNDLVKTSPYWNRLL